MIENSERGITLNKSLAWTMLVAVLAGGVWIGTQVTEAKKGVETLTERQSEDRGSITANREAIARLQSSNARIDQRLISIEQSTSRTENSIEEVLRYLRSQNLEPGRQ
ncbi:MAG: hypothetical protein H5U20_03595 [Rhodobacteraceae bacterium]|nr:hypothetical protein [Paracoccaceae bacterium]